MCSCCTQGFKISSCQSLHATVPCGHSSKSLPTLDLCTLCVVTQIHTTCLCPHLSLHAGNHPTDHLALVSLPDANCASCFPCPKERLWMLIPRPAEAAKGGEHLQRKRQKKSFSCPLLCVIPCISVTFIALHHFLSTQCCADSAQVAAQLSCIYLCSST